MLKMMIFMKNNTKEKREKLEKLNQDTKLEKLFKKESFIQKKKVDIKGETITSFLGIS